MQQQSEEEEEAFRSPLHVESLLPSLKEIRYLATATIICRPEINSNGSNCCPARGSLDKNQGPMDTRRSANYRGGKVKCAFRGHRCQRIIFEIEDEDDRGEATNTVMIDSSKTGFGDRVSLALRPHDRMPTEYQKKSLGSILPTYYVS